MSTPLVASYRIVVPYIIQGLTHEVRAYVKISNAGATPPTIKARNDTDSLDWDDAAQGLWSAFNHLLASEATAGTPRLEHYTGIATIWELVDTASLTGGGQDAGSTLLAAQATLTIRDSENRQIRVIMLDQAEEYTGTFKVKPASTPAAVKALIEQFDGTDTTATAPFMWQRSRKNLVIKATGSFIALTYDTNDKVRRARNLT